MDSLQRLTWTRLARATMLAVAALAVAIPTASAGAPDEKPDRAGAERAKERAKDKPAADCEDRVFSRVFSDWRDRALYTLAPGGDFEARAEGWDLTGSAAVAGDSAPFLLGAALGAGSLELSAGGAAVSPPICVKRGFPAFRFVARSVSAEAGALKVQVVYRSRRAKTTARLKPGAEWRVTRRMSLAQGRFRVRRKGSAVVRLRFAATAGTVRVDDVYVDPRYRK